MLELGDTKLTVTIFHHVNQTKGVSEGGADGARRVGRKQVGGASKVRQTGTWDPLLKCCSVSIILGRIVTKSLYIATIPRSEDCKDGR